MTTSLQVDKTLDEPSETESHGHSAQMGFKAVLDGRSWGEDTDSDESTGDGDVADEAAGMR